MKSIKRLFKLYLPFSKAGVKVELAYKIQIVMWIAISFIEVFFVVFLYEAIYRNSPDGMASVINGFSFYDMILYMLTSFFFTFIMGSGDTSYEIYTDIREGTIANTLTKPVSYRLRHLFTYFGTFIFDWLVVALPFMTIIYGIFIGTGLLKITVGRFIINALLFIVFSIIAGFVNNAISYFVGLMVFYTDHLFGLNMARNAIQGFLGGQMLPLAYMGKLGVVFSYTPFAFMNSVPVLVIMGKVDILQALLYILIAILWILVIETANHFIFKRALTKLAVQGG
jgi:ABC-2 type transport system permease protein